MASIIKCINRDHDAPDEKKPLFTVAVLSDTVTMRETRIQVYPGRRSVLAGRHIGREHLATATTVTQSYGGVNTSRILITCCAMRQGKATVAHGSG